MKSQIIRITIISILMAGIIYLGYKNFKHISTSEESVFTLIPINAAIILQVNNLQELSENIQNIPILKTAKQMQQIDQFYQNLLLLDSTFDKIPKNEKTTMGSIYFSLHQVSKDESSVLFSTHQLKDYDLEKMLSELFKKKLSDLKSDEYDGTEIYALPIKKQNLFIAESNEILFASYSKILMQDAIRQSNTGSNLLQDPNFLQVQETISNSAIANLFFHWNNLAKLTGVFSTKDLSKNIYLNHFAAWSANDVFIKDNTIFSSGLTSVDSKNDFLITLEDQSKNSTNICNIIPQNTAQLLSICLSNTKTFNSKKSNFLQNHQKTFTWEEEKKALEKDNFNYSRFLSNIGNEIGFFTIPSGKKNAESIQFSFVKSKDIDQSSIDLSQLVDPSKQSTYNEIEIFTCKHPNLLSFLFGDFFTTNNATSFVIIEDYFIFSSSADDLKFILDNYLSKNTLVNAKHYQHFQNQISESSTLIYYANPKRLQSQLEKNLNKDWKKKLLMQKDSLQKFTAFAFQLSAGKPLFVNNFILTYDNNYKDETQQEWYSQIDTSLAIAPQIIYDNVTKKELILLQDKNNKIYLISESGEKIMNYQLNEKILNSVTQIDYFNNSKLQTLFNTANNLYLLDRFGRIVEGFPKKLPSATTNPVAVFDYDNMKNYRILMASQGKLYCLEKTGNSVSGWKFNKTSSNITTQLQHVAIEGKDYILYPSKDQNLQLISRDGSTRVKYKNIPKFNHSDLQLNKNGLLYGITTDGKLWTGSLNGSSQEVNLPNSTSNTTLLVNENLLYYTNDQSVYIANEKLDILHTVEVKQSIKNIMLFRDYLLIITESEVAVWQKGKIIYEFPLENPDFIVPSDLDQDGKINLIIGRDAFIYNLELE